MKISIQNESSLSAAQSKVTNKAGMLSPSVYKAELKKVVEQLQLQLVDIDESLANSFPVKATQVDLGILKKACKVASKTDTASGRKAVELSRRAFGLLIASGKFAPF